MMETSKLCDIKLGFCLNLTFLCGDIFCLIRFNCCTTAPVAFVSLQLCGGGSAIVRCFALYEGEVGYGVCHVPLYSHVGV
jgi:hypothetical protein